MAGNLRSPRKRALEIGTASDKLHPDPDYDSQGGFPNNAPGQGGVYQDPADQAKPITGPKPHNAQNPFKG